MVDFLVLLLHLLEEDYLEDHSSKLNNPNLVVFLECLLKLVPQGEDYLV